MESTGSQSHTQLKRLSTHAWAVGKKTTLTIPGQVNTGVTQGQCKQTEGGNAYKNPDRESWNKDSLGRNTRQRGHAGNKGKAVLGPPTSPSLLSFSWLLHQLNQEEGVCVCMRVCVHVLSRVQLCPVLCGFMDCSLPGSSVHGIFQARMLEQVAISHSRRSS